MCYLITQLRLRISPSFVKVKITGFVVIQLYVLLFVLDILGMKDMRSKQFRMFMQWRSEYSSYCIICGITKAHVNEIVKTPSLSSSDPETGISTKIFLYLYDTTIKKALNTKQSNSLFLPASRECLFTK